MGRAHEVRKSSMEKTAAMKSAIYGRAAKEIYIAAKKGSSDPASNLELRAAIDRAKTKQVPSDVIQRAIKRSQGNDNETFIANKYEGYGPGNSMIIVESLTSNVNRAIAEIRDAFNKNDGKLASAGAVSHSFEVSSIFAFEKFSVEEILEKLMETDIEINDVLDDNGITTIYAPFNAFAKLKQFLDEQGVEEYIIAETSMIPNEYMKIKDVEVLNQFNKLINKLNELEDVQNIFHNVVDGVNENE